MKILNQPNGSRRPFKSLMTYEHEVWNETEGFRVVLFIDFVRPIRYPYKLLNDFMVFAAAHIRAMQEAEQNQKKWEKKFYSRKK